MHYYNNSSELFIDDYYKILTKSVKESKDYFLRIPKSMEHRKGKKYKFTNSKIY